MTALLQASLAALGLVHEEGPVLGAAVQVVAASDAEPGKKLSRKERIEASRRRKANLPRLENLPIPAVVRVGKGWTDFMAEMADHIGARATLLLLDRFGGEFVYVPMNPDDSRFTAVIVPEKSDIFSRVYGGEKFEMPVGKRVLLRARRAGVLAAVHAGTLTGADAARILKTRRTSLSRLLADPDEGFGAEPLDVAALLADRAPSPADLLAAAANVAERFIAELGEPEQAAAARAEILNLI